MIGHSRYHVSDEAAGVSQGILKNKLGIKSKKKLNDAETLLLADTYAHFFDMLEKGKVKFDLDLFFSIHKYFLGPLYEWAGKTRTVNISKDEMFFALVKYIDKALEEFTALLKTKLLKQSKDKDELSEKLAIIHNEFNVIHPFREGNGRTVRLFLDLLVVSLGYDPIDWSKTTNSAYLNACIAGAEGKHESMTKIIKKGLDMNL